MSWTNLVLGAWLMLAPFALGYAATPAALGEALVLGLVVVLLSIWWLLATDRKTMIALSVITAVAGLWILRAPFALGYSGVAARHDVLIGMIVLVLSVWQAVAVRAGHGQVPKKMAV
jgi:hypothetical protein